MYLILVFGLVSAVTQSPATVQFAPQVETITVRCFNGAWQTVGDLGKCVSEETTKFVRKTMMTGASAVCAGDTKGISSYSEVTCGATPKKTNRISFSERALTISGVCVSGTSSVNNQGGKCLAADVTTHIRNLIFSECFDYNLGVKSYSETLCPSPSPSVQQK